MTRKQCFLVCQPSGNMARKQGFLVCPPSRNMARKQCFLVCPPSGNMARKQCFLVCPPLGNMARKQCSNFPRYTEKHSMLNQQALPFISPNLNPYLQHFFCISRSTGIFVFFYSMFYFVKRSSMSGAVQTTQFIGWTILICYIFFLMLGTVAFFVSLRFIKYIYVNLKND